jgi:membrane protease YdiL (CAAX protease family)
VTQLKGFLLRHQLLSFFGLAYVISWALWAPVLAERLGVRGTRYATLLLFVGGFGPFLSALLLTFVERGSSGVKAILGRLVLWRVGFGWYLVAFYGFPAYGLLAIVLTGVSSPHSAVSAFQTIFLVLPLSIGTRFLVAGPLGEELGWRGYALPRLLETSKPLVASAVLGCLWAFWHTPLVLIPDWRGTVAVSLFFTIYPLALVALTLIFTWAYLGTGGSLLIAMLLHASYNATLYLFDELFGLGRVDAWATNAVSAVMLWVAALVLLIIRGPSLQSRG